MTNSWFITGTDTEIGKTRCSVALLRYFTAQGYRTVGMKPIAAGCEQQAVGWRNDDALALQAASSVVMPYEVVNPYALPKAIAPHLAAEHCGEEITLPPIINAFHTLRASADIVIMEGAGGWRVPLNDHQSFIDLVRTLHIPVILIVGMRLGCINHALLTAEVLEQDACWLQGWIANWLQPETPEQREVLHAIESRLAAPLLAEMPYQGTELQILGMAHLDLPVLGGSV